MGGGGADVAGADDGDFRTSHMSLLMARCQVLGVGCQWKNLTPDTVSATSIPLHRRRRKWLRAYGSSSDAPFLTDT